MENILKTCCFPRAFLIEVGNNIWIIEVLVFCFPHAICYTETFYLILNISSIHNSVIPMTPNAVIFPPVTPMTPYVICVVVIFPSVIAMTPNVLCVGICPMNLNAPCVVVILLLPVILMSPNALSGVVIIPYVIPMTPNVLYVVIFPSAHELLAL